MYSTSGNKILWNGEEEIFLRGVSRPGLEYLYVDLPAMIPETIQSDLQKMKEWGFNCVRLPLRDKHWFENTNYREMVAFWVQRIRDNGMITLLDLHNQADFTTLQPFLRRLGGKDALQFWEEIVEIYGNKTDVWFELFNEPHDVSPDIWWNGNHDFYGYKEILNVIRKKSSNICILGGLDWAYEWAFLPYQPFYNEIKQQSNLVLSTHPYGYRGKPKPHDFTTSEQIPVRLEFPSYNDSFSGDCGQGITIPLLPYSEFGWKESFGFLHIQEIFPVVATEFGLDRPETALQGGWFNQELIRYFNDIKMGYVAWAWIQDRLDYPSLINQDFEPTGRASIYQRGPACSSSQNWFYQGPGHLVWKDLRNQTQRRALLLDHSPLEKQTIVFPSWSYVFVAFPFLVLFTKRLFASGKKRCGYVRSSSTQRDCPEMIRIFSGSQLRNRSNTCLNGTST